MKLNILIDQYIAYRRALGDGFKSNGVRLKTFARVMGQDQDIVDIHADKINAFLAGKGELTSTWYLRNQTLRGLYRYALTRGYVKDSPLPKLIPKIPRNFVPYIYDVKEIKTLLDAAMIYKRSREHDRVMIRALILLIYGTGLRISEAENLKIADVDLQRSLLTIRESKFYKSRFVPIGKELTYFLYQYKAWRCARGYPRHPDAPFFIRRDGIMLKRRPVNRTFRHLCKIAGIKRTDARLQPRIHDLRHSFAVHRLTQWYKEQADVQRLLPMLSVYLGHARLADTSTYLSMTPELLEEAGHRFQTYAFKKEEFDDQA